MKKSEFLGFEDESFLKKGSRFLHLISFRCFPVLKNCVILFDLINGGRKSWVQTYFVQDTVTKVKNFQRFQAPAEIVSIDRWH